VFIINNFNKILYLTGQHLLLFSIALLGACIIGIGLGILIAKKPGFNFVVPIVNAIQAAPDLVLLAIGVPLLGIGIKCALSVLFLKGILPILRNTYSGIISVDPTLVEAGRGIGMSHFQILTRVELPGALPVIISGIRISAVILVSILTLAAYIGVDSLGTLITEGIAIFDIESLVVGSVLTALLAITANFIFQFIEQKLTSLWQ
jgi:osmoprotectant transport system permease protein